MAKWLVPALALLAVVGAQAQTSPSKKDLVRQIMQAQQPGIEQIARQLVEQPAIQMLQAAGRAVQQRVPPEQREAVARDMQADVRKFVDETIPVVRRRATALAPTTIGPILEERLTEAELKEVLAVITSASWRKFQGLAPDMQKALSEKLVAEMRGDVEARMKALENTLAGRLGIQSGSAASAPK